MPGKEAIGEDEISPKQYDSLVRELGKFIADTMKTGSQALNEDRLIAYWEIGNRLAERRVQHPVTITRLAKDLKITNTLLYRSNQFFATWPGGLTDDAKRLPWYMHILVNGIKKSRERDFYVREALKRGWNDKKLKDAIKNDFYAADKDSSNGVTLARDPNPLYVYKAHLDKVVDGDTIEVRIDVGFDLLLTKQSIRLRGINAAELPAPDRPSADAKRAARAKAFVEEKLVGLPFLVVKTYKTDTHGRFVGDVFYHPKFTDRHDVALKGFYLNEELLRAGLALPDAG